ncbi:sigma-70 family RNA polymerase sigma factor [Phenylobacterium sp.]|uniref:RNA polymerase sigma factor n=1 Tax=Phenylobacterium sp. TaxID=1871053 RepID=UPI00301E2C53
MSDRAERIAWFKAGVLPHEASLRRFLRRTGARDMDLDDLVSEALTRTYAAEDWQRITNGRSYLFTIARNLVFDAARRQKIVAFETVADLDALGLVDAQPSAEAVLTTRDELRVLQAAVDRLPPRAREVFLLRRVENLSQRQVGERLNLSVSTVEGHFTKAIAALTKALQDSDPIRSGDAGSGWRSQRQRR